MNRWIYQAARAVAWFGGLVLVSIALISVASIIGRALSGLGLGPVPGDFELVEVGTALAVFCFLPWCHLKAGHAYVDLFWRAYPKPMRRVLEVATELVTLIVWLLLVWRMSLAMRDYFENGETSFILHMPVWWGYAAAMLPGVFGCAIYAWRLLETLGLAQRPSGFPLSTGEH